MPGADARVVLFAEDPDSGARSAAARYLGAAAMLQLAAAVACADGQAGEAERALMLDQVRAIQGLTAAERRRLGALLGRVSGEPPRIAGLKRRLSALDARGREVVAGFLVELARAARTIVAREIRSLQRSFTLLGPPGCRPIRRRSRACCRRIWRPLGRADGHPLGNLTYLGAQLRSVNGLDTKPAAATMKRPISAWQCTFTRWIA